MLIKPFTTEDNDLIMSEFRSLHDILKTQQSDEEIEKLQKAFNVLIETNRDLYLENGKPYILFPLGVAKIIASEIGLRFQSVICSLLFIPVHENKISIADVASGFGRAESEIIEGILKCQSLSLNKITIQPDNFRKLLLTMAKDVRVILISLAIQLYKLRNITDFIEDDPVVFSQQTVHLYIPIAHRLGLYNLKTEMEDLSMKHTNPEEYELINKRLTDTQKQRQIYIENFLVPVRKVLGKRKLSYEIKWRTKSVYSIWSKIKKQNVSFDEVYDIFAIRIIIDSAVENEKIDCWRVYSMVTDIYPPNPNRLRDWISFPKSNGYKSLHTTVMGPQGKWVEIQIRTQRMNEIAERGLAAHWKYKGGSEQIDFDQQWLKNLKELLENSKLNATDFFDYFSLDMVSNEVFVFTPEGDLKKLPKGATALDFAFEVHSAIGAKCIGARVNNKVVPLRHVLQNGDQVMISTSKNQKAAQDWLGFVVTAKARSKIKKLLDEEKYRQAEEGKEIVLRKLNHWKLFSDDNISRLIAYYKLKNATELYSQVFDKKIDVLSLKSVLLENKPEKQEEFNAIPETAIAGNQEAGMIGDDHILIGQGIKNIKYTFAKCCSPIFGDNVIGFVRVGQGISIHRRKCPNALRMVKKYDYRVLQIGWGEPAVSSSFQAVIKITGNDELGIVNSISNVVSKELKLNMRSFTISSKKGTFEGIIKVYVNGQNQLHLLLRKLTEVNGVSKAVRVES